ncbi:hypothetical protein J0895_18735 [Phormidium pseudopriestleyi FRX01]|uniref:Uncharacterized protein n=1 Tax=Phormidium pseudopriestleyi FRX01 TaxID=1759528 RepID=A0ABS3FVQ6_9CYAN|nr:hypothetical protein [Phormidium pseudopriestleyi]MBO0351069.1 hypothetical protein [Phormidium pseudopriestleyi FRX01]
MLLGENSRQYATIYTMNFTVREHLEAENTSDAISKPLTIEYRCGIGRQLDQQQIAGMNCRMI